MVSTYEPSPPEQLAVPLPEPASLPDRVEPSDIRQGPTFPVKLKVISRGMVVSPGVILSRPDQPHTAPRDA
ncbi:MAG TPA: hypothetical protein VJ622_18870 [Acidimicrobiia bacterium]|nr:hypothetical protein [Acidimicrobiia bacterium]